MHLLLFLHLKDCFLNTVCIDEVISAEFLNLKQNSTEELTEIVQSVITHDLCDVHASTASCMLNEVCTKDYSCSFLAEIQVEHNRYSLYC